MASHTRESSRTAAGTVLAVIEIVMGRLYVKVIGKMTTLSSKININGTLELSNHKNNNYDIHIFSLFI